MERKAIAIELKKKPIPGGMSIILWWNKCFTNELNEIDLSKIKEQLIDLLSAFKLGVASFLY